MLFATISLTCSIVSWIVWTVGLVVTTAAVAASVEYVRNPQFRQQAAVLLTVVRTLWPLFSAAAKSMLQNMVTPKTNKKNKQQQQSSSLFNKAIYVHQGSDMWENVTQALNRAYADERESWPPTMISPGGTIIGQREDGALYYYANQLPPLSDVLENEFLITDEQRKKNIMSQFFPIFGPPLDDSEESGGSSDEEEDDNLVAEKVLAEPTKHAC
jgi:hypothetical protein